ncbi:threonine-trna ligase 2 [Citrus sinensis]|uniref:Threonine-trna ligase 2 n=1 Tax=Citrus sinensis TaxID=2711 RepID=A0ACB8HXI5_CITSI|nr:threonine-trna ligase 2 [Citrus sinensis]
MEGNKISVRALDSDDDLGLKAMADSHQPINFEEALKPFYQRASEAEERLLKLEAALASKKDAGNEEHLKTISNFQSKAENDNAEFQLYDFDLLAEKLATEFEKLKYVEQADAGEGEHLKTIRDLQSELEDAKAEALSERKKAEELAAENEKHKYRIKHLIRALEEADQKLGSRSDHNSEATAPKIHKLVMS